MLGAIIGDIVGSRFEFNNHRDTDFEFFHPYCKFTDDTICTIAVADWLMNEGNPGDIMRYWCLKYPSSYGSMFQRWLHDPGMKPYNSFGNGSAMRVSPVGWAFASLSDVMKYARITANITHNHQEGVKGAECIASSVFMLRTGMGKDYVKNYIGNSFGYNIDQNINAIRETNRFDETCQVTVPQAICCFLESSGFEDAIRVAISIGGDSDTIAAITGSLAEAHYGIPDDITSKAMSYVPEDMLQIIDQFNEKITL